MREHHVGDVLVVETVAGRNVPVGIVTDRDLVVQVLSQAQPPERFTAGDVMSSDLVTALESESVYDAIWHMRSQGVRRLPIVDAQNGLRGMLTRDDVIAFLGTELFELSRVPPAQRERERKRRAEIEEV
jgi:CBS-domain-containing membrane protein